MGDSGVSSTEEIKRTNSFVKTFKRTKSLCTFRSPFKFLASKSKRDRRQGSRRDPKSIYLHSLEENNNSSFESVDFQSNLEKSTIHFSCLTLNEAGLQGSNVKPGKKGSVKVTLRDTNRRFGNGGGGINRNRPLSIATSTNHTTSQQAIGLDLRFIDENLTLRNFEKFDTDHRTTSKTSETSFSSMDTSDSVIVRNKFDYSTNNNHQRNASGASILAEIFPEDYKTRLNSVKTSRMDLSLDSDGMMKLPPLGEL